MLDDSVPGAHPRATASYGEGSLTRNPTRLRKAYMSFVGKIKRLSKHNPRLSDVVNTLPISPTSSGRQSTLGHMTVPEDGTASSLADTLTFTHSRQSFHGTAHTIPIHPPTKFIASLPPPPRHSRSKRTTVEGPELAAHAAEPPIPVPLPVPEPRNDMVRRSLALRLSLEIDQQCNLSQSPSTLSAVTNSSDCTVRRQHDDHLTDPTVDDNDDDDRASFHTLSYPRPRPSSMRPAPPSRADSLQSPRHRHHSYTTAHSSSSSYGSRPLSSVHGHSSLGDDEKRVSLIERRRRRSPLNIPDDELMRLAVFAPPSPTSYADDDDPTEEEGCCTDSDLGLTVREANRVDAMCSLEGRPRSDLPGEGTSSGHGMMRSTPSLVYIPSSPSSIDSMTDDMDRRLHPSAASHRKVTLTD